MKHQYVFALLSLWGLLGLMSEPSVLEVPDQTTVQQKVDLISRYVIQQAAHAEEEQAVTLAADLDDYFSRSGRISVINTGGTEVYYAPEVFVHRLRLLPAVKLRLRSYDAVVFRKLYQMGEHWEAEASSYKRATSFDADGMPVSEKVITLFRALPIKVEGAPREAYNRLERLVFEEVEE